MNKSSFISLGEKIDGFEIVDKEKAPEHLTSQVLWDLWDIGVKFGHLDEKGIRFKASLLYLEIYDYRGNDMGGTAGFVIAKTRQSPLLNEGVSIFQLRNDMTVMWDEGLNISDVQDTIKEIDEFAMSEGDIINGKRKALFEDEQSMDSKFSVTDIFREKDAVMPIFPGMDPQHILSDFDHPELLDIIEMGGLQIICLKSKKENHTKEMVEKIRKLKEMGITVEDVEKMSAQDIITLREKL